MKKIDALYRIKRKDKGYKKYKFPWGEAVMLLSFALPAKTYEYVPESYWWVVVIASALLFFLGLYITLHKLPPRSCWGRAMWTWAKY